MENTNLDAEIDDLADLVNLEFVNLEVHLSQLEQKLREVIVSKRWSLEKKQALLIKINSLKSQIKLNKVNYKLIQQTLPPKRRPQLHVVK